MVCGRQNIPDDKWKRLKKAARARGDVARPKKSGQNGKGRGHLTIRQTFEGKPKCRTQQREIAERHEHIIYNKHGSVHCYY